ncbi:MAG: DUF6691 family protein [Burkholderiales bacterium]
MSALVSAIAAGFVFGLGLWISGMANPAKVIGFLDITGDWDASLALVMAGAVGVTLIAFRLALKRGKPLFDESFALPTRKDIDTPLVAGSALFGIGWGIGGYCPGPGLTALATLSTESVVFVAAMIVGGFVHRAITRA